MQERRRRTRAVLAALALLLAASGNTAGQDATLPVAPPAIAPPATVPPAVVTPAKPEGPPPRRGAQWQNGANTYAVVPEVRAIRLETKHESPASAFTRLGVTTGSVLDRKAGFLIYRDSAGPKSPAGAAAATTLPARKSDPRPVAQNLRTGRYAVVLNALQVELKDRTTAEALASDAGLTLGKQFPNRPRVFYTVPAGMDLIALLGRLRTDPRVVSANVELVEFTRGTK